MDDARPGVWEQLAQCPLPYERWVGRRTQVKLLTPDRLLRRVSATFLAAEAAASLAGTAFGGAAAGFIGLGPDAAGAGVVILASGLLAILAPRVPITAGAQARSAQVGNAAQRAS